jgi:hypothetical protein
MNVTAAPPKNKTVLSAFVNASSSGSNAVLAAPGSTSVAIRVLGVAVVTTSAISVKFQSASTDISATWPLAANGGLVLPFTEHGWFQCAGGEALNVNLSGASATGVHILYMVL